MPHGSDTVERTCPHCGSIVTSEDFFCRACHKRFELRGAETDPTRTAGIPEGSALSLRNPVISATLSFLCIGLGQFYNGDTLKGLVVAIVCLPVVLGYVTFPYATLVLTGIWILSLVEAPVSSWRINHLVKEYTGPSPLFYLVFAIVAGLFLWYMVSGDAVVWIRKISPAAYLLSG
jgi:TM2 domain-containing membrane protein YozV